MPKTKELTRDYYTITIIIYKIYFNIINIIYYIILYIIYIYKI